MGSYLVRAISTVPNEAKPLSNKQLLLKLRNKTGYPLINCKEALAATNYDLAKVNLHHTAQHYLC